MNNLISKYIFFRPIQFTEKEAPQEKGGIPSDLLPPSDSDSDDEGLRDLCINVNRVAVHEDSEEDSSDEEDYSEDDEEEQKEIKEEGGKNSISYEDKENTTHTSDTATADDT